MATMVQDRIQHPIIMGIAGLLCTWHHHGRIIAAHVITETLSTVTGTTTLARTTTTTVADAAKADLTVYYVESPGPWFGAFVIGSCLCYAPAP